MQRSINQSTYAAELFQNYAALGKQFLYGSVYAALTQPYDKTIFVKRSRVYTGGDEHFSLHSVLIRPIAQGFRETGQTMVGLGGGRLTAEKWRYASIAAIRVLKHSFAAAAVPTVAVVAAAAAACRLASMLLPPLGEGAAGLTVADHAFALLGMALS
jgi:hypothetical protein